MRHLVTRHLPRPTQLLLPGLLASALLAPLSPVSAQTGTPSPSPAEQLYTRSLAATCANCHGTDGRGQPSTGVPGLAGLEAHYIQAQMAAFKSGARPATVMHQIAKGYSDAQIATLASYFAAVKR